MYKRQGNEGGTIAGTAPGDSSTGKVIVLVSDGDAKTLMRTLTFVSGVLNVSTLSLIHICYGDRIGLVAFAGEAFTQSPLTTDQGTRCV